jgi:hypothetical protein
MKQEQFSVAFVKAIAAPLGYNPGKYEVDDDSVDIIFSAKYEKTRKIRNPQINFQLKCTKLLPSEDGFLHYPLPIKNYEDLIGTNRANPSYLVVVCIPEREDEWIELRKSELALRYKAFWYSLKDLQSVDNEESVTVLIPIANKFTKDSFTNLMEYASNGVTL